GLNFLHSINIIHMDLKPENVFVSKTGNCIIGDFGGSLCDRSTPSHVYRPARVFGFCTPGYVAPEVVSYGAKFNHLSDFWSLGVTIYDLVVIPAQFDANLTHLQMGLEAFMMAQQMKVYGCPCHIWFMVTGVRLALSIGTLV
ncbi:kinase-like domain-containing protein, partial [Gymnopilus junonius]